MKISVWATITPPTTHVKATSNLILARRVFRHLAARREEHRALVHDADQQSLESTRLFLRREHAGG